MAEEFQSGICSGNWWNSERSGFNGGSSSCTTALTDIGSYGWPTEMVEMKVRSCEESTSVSGSSIVFQDTQKPQGSDSVGGGGAVLMDSTLQMMGFGLSSPTTDWNQQQALFSRSSGRAEGNFHSMIQEDLSSRSSNFRQETGMESVHQEQKDWSAKNFSASGENSSVDEFKQINQGLPMNFSMGSASYGCPSTLFQGFFEPDPQPQQPPYDNRTMNYPSPTNYRMNSNELPPSWQKFPQSSSLKTSPPKQQPINQLHFSNNAPFWKASAAAAAAAAMNDVRSSFFPLPQNQFQSSAFEEKPNCSNNLIMKPNTEEVRDSGSMVKKSSGEPTFKRPRIETPSPLPTFKVRKEKLGDRITALQQLVSPFGKTDTASVLFEAIEYIKFLHEQVTVLSNPYMKNGPPIQHHQNSNKSKVDPEGPKQDLRSRGLCLVPISSTYPVTNETSADFWTPTFGGSYR